MSLESFVAGLVKGGNAANWPSFGQSNKVGGIEQGQDIYTPLGTPIPADPGTITDIVNWGGTTNYAVSEQTANGVITVGHLQKPNLAVGQKLTGGILGYSGGLPTPGVSTGPHIEVRYQKAPGASYQNPIPVLTGVGNAASAVGTAASGAASAAGGIAGGIGGLLTFVFGDIVRILLGLLGIVTILIGLYILLRPNDAPTITQLAGTALKLGAA